MGTILLLSAYIVDDTVYLIIFISTNHGVPGATSASDNCTSVRDNGKRIPTCEFATFYFIYIHNLKDQNVFFEMFSVCEI